MRLFWRNFFSLLLLVTAVAQWLCAAWVLTVVLHIEIFWPLHLVVPFALWRINRVIVAAPLSSTRRNNVVRLGYTRVAFGSLFGMLALAATAAFWASAHVAFAMGEMAGFAPPTHTLAPLAKFFGTMGLGGVGSAIAYGYTRGQEKVWVNNFDVPLAGLGSGLEGLRVAQISDLHLGRFMTAERIAKYVETINKLSPDLIVITGDITDGLDHAPSTFAALAGLEAPMGVIAIMGNHDVYTGADEVEAALAHYTDFTVLRDAAMVLERGGDSLHVLGVNDHGESWAQGPSEHPALARLAATMDPGVPAVLLTHRPDCFEQAAKMGIGLVLAGHTHGGQLALPVGRSQPWSLARFMTRYPRGTFRRGRSTLHVNLGLGVTGQPIRVATPREITVLTLKRPSPLPMPSQGEAL